MKKYKGQIDDTFKEIDLTDFFKENPKFVADKRSNKKA